MMELLLYACEGALVAPLRTPSGEVVTLSGSYGVDGEQAVCECGR